MIEAPPNLETMTDSEFWDSIRFFEKSEFACSCCGESKMDREFVFHLDFIRGRLHFPLRVNSGYRCPDHNERVSSTGRTGPHTTGKAADLGVFGRQAHELIREALVYRWFTGLGVNQRGAHASRFVHLDALPTDSKSRPTVRTY